MIQNQHEEYPRCILSGAQSGCEDAAVGVSAVGRGPGGALFPHTGHQGSRQGEGEQSTACVVAGQPMGTDGGFLQRAGALSGERSGQGTSQPSVRFTPVSGSHQAHDQFGICSLSHSGVCVLSHLAGPPHQQTKERGIHCGA